MPEFLSEHALQIVIIVAAVIVIGVIVRAVKRQTARARSFIRQLLNAAGTEQMAEQKPKSLSGADSIFLPRILKDFPEFNLSNVKRTVSEYIKNQLSDRGRVTVHNIVIKNYTSAGISREIVFQAAVEIEKQGRKEQRRYCVVYNFSPESKGDGTLAANCPNCGAPLSSTAGEVCAYCGSRSLNVLSNKWKIVDMYED